MNNLIVVLLIILFFLFNYNMLFTKSKLKKVSSNSNERFTDIISSAEKMDTLNYNILYLTKPILPSKHFYLVSYSQLAFTIQTKIIELIKTNEITIDSNLNNIADLEELIQYKLEYKPKHDILFAVDKSAINVNNLIQFSSTIVFDSDSKPQYLKDSTTLKIIVNNPRNSLSHNNTILFIKASNDANITTINDNNIISNFDDGNTRKLIELVPIRFFGETNNSPLYLVSLTNSTNNNYNINTTSLSLKQNV